MNLQFPVQHALLQNSIIRSTGAIINGNPKLQLRYAHQQNQRRVRLQEDEDPYKHDWKILQIAEDSGQEKVRKAYLDLAKIYHPDSGGEKADAERFHKIDKAYKNLQRKFAEERHNQHQIEGEYGLYYKEKSTAKKKKAEAEDELDVKHTAAQHRHYLNFDGVGTGTPAQREKLYQRYRASKAAGNVYEHRINKIAKESGTEETAVQKDTREAKKIKTGLGIERLVEDMIQESMARGDFENLKGQGKPLKHDPNDNPYIDFTTRKLNQVLIDNGFTPEWILLEKEIREDIALIRETLSLERHKYHEILEEAEEVRWNKFVAALKPELDILNLKINKYNLVVPTIHKQIIGLQLDRESKRAIQNFSEELYETRQNEAVAETLEPSKSSGIASKPPDSFFGMMFSMFGK